MRTAGVGRVTQLFSRQKYNVWVHIKDYGASEVQLSSVTSRREAVTIPFAFGVKEGWLGGLVMLGQWLQCRIQGGKGHTHPH